MPIIALVIQKQIGFVEIGGASNTLVPVYLTALFEKETFLLASDWLHCGKIAIFRAPTQPTMNAVPFEFRFLSQLEIDPLF